MTLKRLLIIIGIVVIILVIGGFIYYTFFLNNQSNNGVFDGPDDVDVFPFGSGDSRDSLGDDLDTDMTGNIAVDVFSDNEEGLKYFNISRSPVAGLGWVENGRNPGLYYVERATGHIFSFDVNSLSKERISNTTIPKVQEAFFSNSGDSVVLRYIDEETGVIKTFSTEIKSGDNGIGELDNGVFMLNGIESIVSFPTTDKLFYLVRRVFEVGGISSNFDNSNKDELVVSGVKDWNLQWFNNNHILFTTKPSVVAEGFAYILNTSTESFNKVLGNILGLTTNSSPDGENVLYSESSNNRFTTSVFSISDESLERSFLTTLPEKCVWGNTNGTVYCGVPRTVPSGEYPDDWYQGIISFDDNIWFVDLENFETTKLLSPSNVSNESVDAVNLVLSDDDSFLFFINKKDLSLWGLQLK